MKRKDEDDESGLYRKRARMGFSTFTYSPIRVFDKCFPYFGQPKEISHFSLIVDKNICLNRSCLKYLYDKNVNCKVTLDLKDGFNSYVSKDDGPGDISILLKWFGLYFDDKNKYVRQRPDFLCWRGLITKVLVTPYENSEGWLFAAEKFGETIFLMEMETQQKVNRKMEKTERDNQMSYWGYKFEQYMTTEKAGDTPTTDVPVDCSQNFVSVVKTQLGDHSIVFGGEVDCCTIENESDYVELKTTRKIDSARQQINFKRYKLLKWWAQSFLLGIPRIVCGFRDDDGIVHGTETFRTLDIPRMCRADDDDRSWRGNVCFNFLKEFLQFVKDSVKDEGRTYKFEWSPRRDVSCEAANDVGVLTQEFKEKFRDFFL